MIILLFLITNFFTNYSFNFFFTYSSIWSLTYFSLFFYNLLVFSIIFYLVSNIKDFTNYNNSSNYTIFNYIPGLTILGLVLTPIILILILNFSWTGPLLTSWFGHLSFTSFQLRITYFIILIFIFIWLSYSSFFYYSSQEVYDYTIIIYSFFFELFDYFMQIIYLQLFFLLKFYLL